MTHEPRVIEYYLSNIVWQWMTVT